MSIDNCHIHRIGLAYLVKHFKQSRLSVFMLLFCVVLFSAFTNLTDAKSYAWERDIPSPRIVLPSSNTIIDSVCLIQWTQHSKHRIYEVQISNNMNFSEYESYYTKDSLLEHDFGAPSYLYKYIRVRAYKSKNRASEWSNILTIVHGFSLQKIDMFEFKGCSGNCKHHGCNHSKSAE